MRKSQKSEANLEPPAECPACRLLFFKLFAIKKDMVWIKGIASSKE